MVRFLLQPMSYPRIRQRIRQCIITYVRERLSPLSEDLTFFTWKIYWSQRKRHAVVMDLCYSTSHKTNLFVLSDRLRSTQTKLVSSSDLPPMVLHVQYLTSSEFNLALKKADKEIRWRIWLCRRVLQWVERELSNSPSHDNQWWPGRLPIAKALCIPNKGCTLLLQFSVFSLKKKKQSYSLTNNKIVGRISQESVQSQKWLDLANKTFLGCANRRNQTTPCFEVHGCNPYICFAYSQVKRPIVLQKFSFPSKRRRKTQNTLLLYTRRRLSSLPSLAISW